MDKLNVEKINFFFNLRFFCEKHYPTRHNKFKVINFAPINKSIMANILRSTNLVRILRRIKSPLTR